MRTFVKLLFFCLIACLWSQGVQPTVNKKDGENSSNALSEADAKQQVLDLGKHRNTKNRTELKPVKVRPYCVVTYSEATK